jgi:hypothetical protein
MLEPAPAVAPALVAARGPVDPLSTAALLIDVAWLCDPARRGRGSLQPGGVRAADYVAAEFRRIGLEVRRQKVVGSAENIIGVKPGASAADEQAVIVSAHYDHLGIDDHGVIYPGADDNASGVAVLLAIARVAAAVPTRHTILFISFGAEEPGLLGSGAYVYEPVWPLALTRGVINFDMVGRNFFEAGVRREAAVGVVGLEADSGARIAVERAASQVGLAIVPAPARLMELFSLHDRTDDWWFRRQNIVSIHFSTGYHEDYHQASDTPDKLVPRQMERIARTALGLLWYLAERL